MALGMPTTLSDHPSLVGIVRFPNCAYSTNLIGIPNIIKGGDGAFMNITQMVDMADNITGSEKTSQTIPVAKSKVTDMFPYTYYVLTDGECEPLIMHPQYLPSSFTVKGTFALSHQPVERYYPSSYKGDSTGRIYNITNLNQMMLPTATNEGIGYLNANANTISTVKSNQQIAQAGALLTGVGMGLMGNIGGAVSSVGGLMSGHAQIRETDARNKDLSLTPATISSYGTPSTRRVFATDDVRIVKYTVTSNVKNKIENYVARYGNKYNNYGVIDIKTYKGFVKFLSPDLDTKVDNTVVSKIRSILERGVYIE